MIEDIIIAFAPAREFAGNEVLASGEFVWMPVGKHSITAGTSTGKPFVGDVLVDEASFKAISASFQRTLAKGTPPWIDLNHNDAEAAAWVKGFSWDPARGIIASVEWTPVGKRALEEKQFRSFSPAFTLDRESKRPSGIYEGHAAGGLVNAPAFGAAMPALIAARLGGADSTNPAPGGTPESQPQTTMSQDTNPVPVAPAAPVLASTPAPAAAPDLTAVLAQVAEFKAELAAIKAAKPVAAAAPAPVVVPVIPADPVVVASKPGAFEAIRAMLKEPDHRKRGAIYCSELRPFVSQSNVAEILAANSFGTVTSTLIVLRALDLLKLNFPILQGRISTSFTDGAVKFGQTVTGRIITVPTVGTYNTSTGYGIANATTTDVSVVINAHKHITIALHAEEAAGTPRDLFAEQAEAMQYALGKDLVDALYAKFLIADYTNATTVATASITRTTLPVALAKAFNTRGVPQMNRTLLLNVDAFAALATDASIVSLATNLQPELITNYTLPQVSGFQPIEAVNLPSTGNMTGFALTPDAALIATRLPVDYTQALPGSSHGSVSTVTNPDTGISVLKTDFVDHTLGTANSRIAWMYGVAKGQVASGQIIKSS